MKRKKQTDIAYPFTFFIFFVCTKSIRTHQWLYTKKNTWYYLQCFSDYTWKL